MVKRRTDPRPEEQRKPIPCGNCGRDIVAMQLAWTSSPKGRVCNYCWRGYMDGAWPKMGANA